MSGFASLTVGCPCGAAGAASAGAGLRAARPWPNPATLPGYLVGRFRWEGHELCCRVLPWVVTQGEGIPDNCQNAPDRAQHWRLAGMTEPRLGAGRRAVSGFWVVSEAAGRQGS